MDILNDANVLYKILLLEVEEVALRVFYVYGLARGECGIESTKYILSVCYHGILC